MLPQGMEGTFTLLAPLKFDSLLQQFSHWFGGTAAADYSSELETGCGWVPAAAATAEVGLPIALAAAGVPCPECRTQSGNAVAELRVLPQGSSSSSLPA